MASDRTITMQLTEPQYMALIGAICTEEMMLEDAALPRRALNNASDKLVAAWNVKDTDGR